MVHFIFPFNLIEKGSRVVLYGAGNVGQDFYSELSTIGYCKVVNWFDKNYEWYKLLGLPVENPELIGTDILKNEDYDYMVISVREERSAKAIEKYLIQKGVDEKKLVWTEKYFVENAAEYDASNVVKPEHADESYLISPVELINENRLDIVIRYMYAKSILEHKRENYYRYLYFKLIICVNEGKEPVHNAWVSIFSEYEQKIGLQTFDRKFRELIKSMAEDGFKREYYIPIGTDDNLLNAAHRCAAALALGQDVWVYKYPCTGAEFRWPKEYFIEHGFEPEEVEEIEWVYSELVNKK